MMAPVTADLVPSSQLYSRHMQSDPFGLEMLTLAFSLSLFLSLYMRILHLKN